MSRKEKLYAHPVTLNLAWNDPDANLRMMEEAVDARLAASPAIAPQERLFIFPELTLTGFVTKDPKAFAPESADPVIERLRGIARRRRTGLVAGFPEVNGADPRRPLNALALIGADGRVVGRYHKLHLFTWGKHPETESYAAGKTGVVCRYRGWKIGLALCFDIRFPPLFHQYAKAGVDLLVVSSCWIDGPTKTQQYRTINAGHAILTQAFLATANRCGKDPFFAYDGSEHVFSPRGESLYEGGPVELDPEELTKARSLVVRPSDLDFYSVE